MYYDIFSILSVKKLFRLCPLRGTVLFQRLPVISPSSIQLVLLYREETLISTVFENIQTAISKNLFVSILNLTFLLFISDSNSYRVLQY